MRSDRSSVGAQPAQVSRNGQAGRDVDQRLIGPAAENPRALFISVAMSLLPWLLVPITAPVAALRHDGPDPLWHWQMIQARRDGDRLLARFGPPARCVGTPTLQQDARGESMYFDGKSALVVADSLADLRKTLPRQHVTLATWVSIETPQQWGGVFSLFQDNGNAEQGVVLGYDEQVFLFGLASAGADDGDGKMTYLRGKTKYELGRLYHVVAVYDGEAMQLYVNGQLEATSKEQHGAILWPAEASLTLGSYHDRNEDVRHHGTIREIAVYDLAAPGKWIAEQFGHGKELATLPAVRHYPDALEFVVAPYQQFVTRDGVTLMWETSRPASSVVHFGPDDKNLRPITSAAAKTLHEVRIDSLAPRTPYFWRVESRDDKGQSVTSPLLTMRTACDVDDAYAFVVIGDTQDQPQVAGRIATHAWGLRPDFAVIAGDLVGTGPNKQHWTRAFFPSMKPLIERVAFFPVIGNHEQDARFYYDYVALPDPEHHYTFSYGNSQWFMLDSNREVGPGSAQYAWLERELGKCTATWKFVCYHHPSYSSDEDDYGDTWKGPSSHGDLRVRQLVPLFDRHGVDIVWNGHIHSYERTWPLRGERVVSEGGTTYIITGGGGGHLETAGPIRPFFQNNVRHGHHFCFVAVHANKLEFKAFDLENRLYDVTTIEKRRR